MTKWVAVHGMKRRVMGRSPVQIIWIRGKIWIVEIKQKCIQLTFPFIWVSYRQLDCHHNITFKCVCLHICVCMFILQTNIYIMNCLCFFYSFFSFFIFRIHKIFIIWHHFTDPIHSSHEYTYAHTHTWLYRPGFKRSSFQQWLALSQTDKQAVRHIQIDKQNSSVDKQSSFYLQRNKFI